MNYEENIEEKTYFWTLHNSYFVGKNDVLQSTEMLDTLQKREKVQFSDVTFL